MRILLTGGGTAGHIVPNLAIAEALSELSPKTQLHYMGSKQGMERNLAQEMGMPYSGVSTGKWRRYFDFRNFLDPFRIALGTIQAFFKLGSIKPDLIFSKGGFVAFPVVVAAWLRRIPIIIHESDLIPGLGTKLSARMARQIFLNFPETEAFLKKYKKKLHVTGSPVRQQLFDGSPERAKKNTGFSGERPVLLVMGGSTGSKELNERIWAVKDELIKHYDVIHLLGEGKGHPIREPHYMSVEYAGEEFKDYYALASSSFCRAGAGTLADLEALQLPALLAPLGLHASRGDQIENAKRAIEKYPYLKLFQPDIPLVPQILSLPARGKLRQKSHVASDIAKRLLKAIATKKTKGK